MVVYSYIETIKEKDEVTAYNQQWTSTPNASTDTELRKDNEQICYAQKFLILSRIKSSFQEMDGYRKESQKHILYQEGEKTR